MKRWFMEINLLPLVVGAVVLFGVLAYLGDFIHKIDVAWFYVYALSLCFTGPLILYLRVKAKKFCKHCMGVLFWENQKRFEAVDQGASKYGRAGYIAWVGNLFENLDYKCSGCHRAYKYNSVMGWLGKCEK